LIVRGKQAEDNQSLEDLQIKEGDFMVVMVSKKPLQTNPPSGTSQTQSTQPDVKPESQALPKPLDTQGTQPSTDQKSESYVDHASTLIFGSQLESTITEIINMGFEREQVIKAMKAAFNNPDRAIEYLFSGIPENVGNPLGGGGGPGLGAGTGLGGTMGTGGGLGAGTGGTSALGQQSGGLGGVGTGGTDPSGSGEENPLAFLSGNPMFQQIRAAIQANPALLQSLLAQLANTNPQLFQLITQNQEAFLKLLMEGGGEGGFGGAGGQGGPGGQHVIHVTKEEKEAIDRLVSLGFPKPMAIEAFLACDKNEQLAANYLLERQMEEGFGGPSQGQNPSGGNNNSGGGEGGAGGNNQPGGDEEDDNMFG